MKTLNTDLSDQERLNSFLGSAGGILINQSTKGLLGREQNKIQALQTTLFDGAKFNHSQFITSTAQLFVDSHTFNGQHASPL